VSASARVVAQAKVNLLLRILAREQSGYHALETIFLRLDLGDDVVVRAAPGRTIDAAGPAMPPEGLGPTEKNLAYRAAVAYSDATGWPAGFSIEITKRIPVGGGLGGGSADAGAVLRALDALSPSPLGSRLVELGGELGADVPFMAIDSPMALAWSRGERLLPLRAPEPRPTVLVVPSFGINTAEAYGWLSHDRDKYEPVGGLIAPDNFATWEGIVGSATNDFEAVVGRRHPVIAEVVDELAAAGALISMLSGSGSTVFGVFDQVPNAAALTRSTRFTTLATKTSSRVEQVTVAQ
jgi:4-diphosphocytidyl-2-C-methyl-D-erythritol kinase